MVNKKYLIYFILFITIISVVFYSLITNLSRNLPDWYDTPYIVWLIIQNTDKLKALNFIVLFNTNAFYPHHNTLFFSDTYLPQSLMALPVSFFTTNPILIFNLLFFAMLILNYFCAFLLWQQIFKKEKIAFFGALLLVFSPFFTSTLSHFQLMAYFLFLFCFLCIFKNQDQPKIRYLVMAGVSLALQFLAGVYLSVFLLFSLALYYLIRLIVTKNIKLISKNLGVILLIFVLIDGVFINKYLEVKKNYQVKRDIKEYIQYSAHVTDYIFSNNINSLIHTSSLIKKWNSFNKHNWGELAVFPGFLLLTLSFLSLISLKKNQKEINIGVRLNSERAFFLLLMLVGLIFSFGPRINFNGYYAHLPSPYTLIIKTLPFIEVVRVSARWSFIFYLGMIYFALDFLNNIHIEKKAIL